MLRNAALRQWKVGTLDVTAAFLHADIVTPNKEVLVVKVPSVLRMIGVKEKSIGEHIKLYTGRMCLQDLGVLVEERLCAKLNNWWL